MLKLRPPPEVPPASIEALALADALRTLPIRQRQVLVLHYLVDLPVEEVAHTLGMPRRHCQEPAVPRSPCAGGQAR
jgi:DNA-directed RNA polymerase specialized sigma24 family protein